MKPNLILVPIILIAMSANSQLTNGNWLVGGTGTLYFYNKDFTTSTYYVEYKNSNIDISSSLGYFIKDKIALGIRPTFSWTKERGINSSGGVSGGYSNIKRYSIGPFGRYYFLQHENPFNILADLSYQIGFTDYHGENSKTHNLSIMAGPVIYFNSSVGIELLLGYSSRSEDLKNSYKDVRKGFQTHVGFQIHLQKD